MNIPQSVIEPFEPHGLPKLNLVKGVELITLEIILNIMDALDNFIKDKTDNYFAMSDIIEDAQLRAMGDALCGFLEKAAMDAGADIVKAQARAIYTISEEIEKAGDPNVYFPSSAKCTSQLIGFMFLIDFTVNDEDVNHILEHKFKRRKR